MYFAAIELKKGETPQDAIKHFVAVASDQGILFRKLQVFGPIEFGCFKFIRFRTDCHTFPPIIARLKSDGRGIIAPSVTGYRAFLSNGREGQAGVILMQGVPLPGHGKTYLGPQHPYWREQFKLAPERATPEDPHEPSGAGAS